MNHFTRQHPEITPEKYVLNKLDKRINYRKGLYIPNDPTESFKIIYDEPRITLEKYINTIDKLEVLPLHPNYHIYMDLHYFNNFTYLNVVATKLYKMSFLNNVGKNSNISIHGPIVVYGTDSNFQSCSVPYEIVEQTFRLYNNYY